MFPTFTFFGRTIGLYPVLAIAGGLCAGAFAMAAAKRRGYGDQAMLELLLWSALGAFLGGSLLYIAVSIQSVISYWQVASRPYTLNTILGFIRLLFGGGSVFYGGLLGGLLAGFLYARRKKLPVAAYTDICAPAIPLFHCFGRIGCLLGGCCYGIPWPGGITFTHALVPSANGVPRFPIQLLESGFNLALFLLLTCLLAKNRLQGRLLALYLLLYPAARFCFEFLRGDTYRGFALGLSTSQWISIILFLFSSIYLVFTMNKKRIVK